MRRLHAVALLAVLVPYGVCGAQDQPAVQKQLLLETTKSWDGATYQSYPAGQPEISVLKITIPAHTTMQWHTHPMPNAAYVLSGELTVEKKENGEKQVLTAGQVLPELVNTLHRGVAGDAPVVLIVFYAGAKGMPLSEARKPAGLK